MTEPRINGADWLPEFKFGDAAYAARHLKSGDTGLVLIDRLTRGEGSDRALTFSSTDLNSFSNDWRVALSSAEVVGDPALGGEAASGYEAVVFQNIQDPGIYVLATAGVTEALDLSGQNELFGMAGRTNRVGYDTAQYQDHKTFLDAVIAQEGSTFTNVKAVGHSGGHQLNVMAHIDSALNNAGGSIFSEVMGFNGYGVDLSPDVAVNFVYVTNPDGSIDTIRVPTDPLVNFAFSNPNDPIFDNVTNVIFGDDIIPRLEDNLGQTVFFRDTPSIFAPEIVSGLVADHFRENISEGLSLPSNNGGSVFNDFLDVPFWEDVFGSAIFDGEVSLIHASPTQLSLGFVSSAQAETTESLVLDLTVGEFPEATVSHAQRLTTADNPDGSTTHTLETLPPTEPYTYYEFSTDANGNKTINGVSVTPGPTPTTFEYDFYQAVGEPDFDITNLSIDGVPTGSEIREQVLKDLKGSVSTSFRQALGNDVPADLVDFLNGGEPGLVTEQEWQLDGTWALVTRDESGNPVAKTQISGDSYIRQTFSGSTSIVETYQNGVRDIAVRVDDALVSFGQLGSIFGSTLGRQIVGDDPLAQVAAGTFFGVVGQNLFQTAGHLIDGKDLATAIDEAASDLGYDLEGAAIGAASSLLVGELINALPSGIAHAYQNGEGLMTVTDVTGTQALEWDTVTAANDNGGVCLGEAA